MGRTIEKRLIIVHNTYHAANKFSGDFVMDRAKLRDLTNDEEELRNKLAEISSKALRGETSVLCQDIELALERIPVIREIHSSNFDNADSGYFYEIRMNHRGTRIHEALRLVKVKGSDLAVELLRKLQEDAYALELEKNNLEKSGENPERLNIVEKQLGKLREIARIVTEDQVDDSGSDVENKRHAQAAE